MSSSAGRSLQSQDSLETLVQMTLDEAVRQGAGQAEAAANHDIGLSVTARLGDVENLEYTNDRGVGVTVYVDSCKGSASTSDFSEAALIEAVTKAISFARYTEADEYAGLADADRMASDIPDLSLAHDWDLPSSVAIELAIDCETSARDYDKRITNSEGATVATNSGLRAYGNTHGFLASYPRTSHSISCMVVGEADGDMQRDYFYTTARDATQLDTPADVGRKAAERTIRRLGARKLKTTKAPVVFSAELARGFMGHAIAALSGGAPLRVRLTMRKASLPMTVIWSPVVYCRAMF